MSERGKNISIDLQKEFEIIINKFLKENYKATQESLKKITEIMVNRLTEITPIGKRGGVFKRGWKFKDYFNVNYIYNQEGVLGINSGIPLTNLFEYSKNHRPFIQLSWNQNKKDIERLFIEDIQKRFK
ncbi:MAG: hypothetical protein RBT65_07545 [Methanolobus sp.]|nr:hypothetical protein [Methanolobus sp.]